MAKISGSLVRSESSTTTPPRVPTSRPQARRQLVARPDSRRDHDHVDIEHAAAGKGQALHLAVAQEFLGALVEVNLHAQTFDFFAQRPRPSFVNLPRHEPRRKLDDVRFDAQVAHGLGGLEPKQASAQHRRAGCLR